jgi:hypothetical protein
LEEGAANTHPGPDTAPTGGAKHQHQQNKSRNMRISATALADQQPNVSGGFSCSLNKELAQLRPGLQHTYHHGLSAIRGDSSEFQPLTSRTRFSDGDGAQSIVEEAVASVALV